MTMSPLPMVERVSILADSAKYDVSCSSSGSTRRAGNGVGNAASCGICHSWTSDGRCVSLLKILLTNSCIYDCAFCANRRSNDRPRAMLAPREVAELTIGFYRRNYIEGLFLSTGIVRSPDYTMELLIRTVRLLREEHRFNGYIHLKLIPGADLRLVEEAGRLADRVSVNIELPTGESLALLAPEKKREAVVLPMGRVHDLIRERKVEQRKHRNVPIFASAGQSTQLIVGATPENDRQIIGLSERLYRRYDLRRVYYSAFIPVNPDPRLPALPGPPLLREHRLYQADWLLRFYGFEAHELLDETRPFLDRDVDPKTGWALRHLHLFPVEVNSAEYEVLLRVPGIGVTSAKRIIRARRMGRLSLDDLKTVGVVMKRARYFVTVGGKGAAGFGVEAARLKSMLTAPARGNGLQLSLFPAEVDASAIVGEL